MHTTGAVALLAVWRNRRSGYYASGGGSIFVSTSNRNRFELLIVDISVWLIAAENELQVIDDGLLASLLYR